MSTNPEFQQWMKQVDGELIAICGLSHDDLADCTYYDYFLAGIDPREAAELVLEYNDFPMELL